MESNHGSNNQNVRHGNLVDYHVDVVFCIDGTETMGNLTDGEKNVSAVKQKLLNLYHSYNRRMVARGREFGQFRIRLIVFRDYLADGEHAMMVTDFFCLPQQEKSFETCVNSICFDGGGDLPEDGLEALAYAIKSRWTNEGHRRRKVIMVWSDAGTHELGFGSSSPHYPKGMARDMDELTDWWEQLPGCKRLVFITPEEPGWSYIADHWEDTIHVPTAAGDIPSEDVYEEILYLLA